MTDLSRLTPQQRIIQYRERARFAIERAARNPQIRQGCLELAQSWNALAEALESEFGHNQKA
jgi:hypothetical protein